MSIFISKKKHHGFRHYRSNSKNDMYKFCIKHKILLNYIKYQVKTSQYYIFVKDLFNG
jgi:hypothetical protein